jgi:poly(3-hydroxyalkanoate) depolymerase
MKLERAVRGGVGRLSISAVVRDGSEPGVPLLMCNGIGAHHEALKPFTDALDPRITTVRFDAPGVGASSVPLLPLPFAMIALVATRLMDRLGYDRFDVLGISWGGGLAQQIAFQNPRRCRRVVLAATATGSIMVPGRPGVLRHMVTPGRHRDAAHARSIAGRIYGGSVRQHPELAESLLIRSDRPPTRRGYLYQLLAGVGWTSLPVLPTIRQPTLLLAGTDDPLVPLVNARVMSWLMPNARLHTFDDGHLGLLTRASELAPVVSGFLQEPIAVPRARR